MRISKNDLEGLNARFQDAPPTAVLRFARETFGARAALLSSMQRAGTALCFVANREGLSFDVLFVDTGVLHQETLATRDRLARTHTHLRVRTLSPGRTFAEQTREEDMAGFVSLAERATFSRVICSIACADGQRRGGGGSTLYRWCAPKGWRRNFASGATSSIPDQLLQSERMTVHRWRQRSE